MIEIRQILCPIDFSEPSRRALDYAVALAGRFGSTITAFHVCPLAPATAYAPGPLLPVTVPTPDELQALLTSMQRFVGEDTGARASIRYEIGEGGAATEILERAQAIPSDLIVMGTHGRSGVDRLLLGSVTERVVRKAKCPVLTVAPPVGEVTPVPDRLFSRILCGIDFSRESLRALEYALLLAADANARVKLAHVVEVTPAPESDAGEVETRTLGAYVAAAAEARAEQLQSLVPKNIEKGLSVDTIVAIGKSHREILRIAAEDDSDLIVLGAHGLGIPQLLFGSTAQQVVRQARCPVLTTR